MSITPVTRYGPWVAKREDQAAFVSPNYPSGSKVRQYLSMSQQSPSAPMMVGCSATSAMQVYVAYASSVRGVKGIVYVPKRNIPSASTAWARAMGADVHEVPYGYLSVVRKRARDRGKELGATVRWDAGFAIRDVAYQCQNIPPEVRRVVVTSGTGLICSGILAGLSLYWKNPPEVLAVSVSGLFDRDQVIASAQRLTDRPLPTLTSVRHPYPYGKGVAAILPDGTPLDPYYAAKSVAYLKEGDCLWVPGVRPLGAFPTECLNTLFLLNPSLRDVYQSVPDVSKLPPIVVEPNPQLPEFLPQPLSVLDLMRA